MKSDSRFFAAIVAVVGLLNSPPLEASDTSGGDVMLMMFPSHSEGRPVEVRRVCDRVYSAAQKQAHHLLGLVHPWQKDETLLLRTDSKSGEHWIRPNTGAVAGLAFLYRFGEHDERSVRASGWRAINGVPMMRYLITTHKTGTRATSDDAGAWRSNV